MTTPRLGGTSSPTASLGNSSSSSGASTRSSSGSNASNHNHNSMGSSGGKNGGPAAAANVFDEAAVSERVWARAIHAVTEQKLSLRSVARLYGLHYMALHRRVRARQAAQSLSLHRQAGLNVDVAAANGPTRAPNGYNGLMANTERFEPPSRLPERPMTLENIRMTDDQNDEAMTMLYEEYGPSIIRHRRDGASDNSYCYDDDDIREVVRYVVARDSRRDIPPQFPSQRWLSVFKRENGLVDGISPLQEDNFHQQFQYATSIGGNDRDYAMAQSGNWARASPHPGRSTPSPMRSRQTSQEFGNDNYSTSESESNDSSPRQNAAQSTSDQKQQKKQAKNSSEPKHYRQSNTVPAEVWDRAMEDVLIHGMSLRSAAKAHGVHFAALHRRLKKRSLQKDTMPYDPRYIPFEDEAGLIRVINARADLGVLMSYKEVIDLLQRATLNHRSELSEEDVVELVRKFRSRVEGSIRHLVKDWPLPSVNALYQQLGPVPTSAAVTTTTSMTSTSMAMTVPTSAPSSMSSSVSPRVVLPPASSLRVNGAIPTIPSIISPRGGYGSGTSSNGVAAGNGELVNGVSPRVGSSSRHPSPPRILRL